MRQRREEDTEDGGRGDGVLHPRLAAGEQGAYLGWLFPAGYEDSQPSLPVPTPPPIFFFPNFFWGPVVKRLVSLGLQPEDTTRIGHGGSPDLFEEPAHADL